MATRNWVYDKTSQSSHTIIATVSGLLNGDTSDNLTLSHYPNKTFHVFGTFGVGGNVRIRGRNSSSGALQPLNTNDGGAASGLSTITSELLRSVTMNPAIVVADVSAGDGTTSLTVVVVGQRDG